MHTYGTEERVSYSVTGRSNPRRKEEPLPCGKLPGLEPAVGNRDGMDACSKWEEDEGEDAGDDGDGDDEDEGNDEREGERGWR